MFLIDATGTYNLMCRTMKKGNISTSTSGEVGNDIGTMNAENESTAVIMPCLISIIEVC